MSSPFGYFISITLLVLRANAFQNMANCPHFQFRSGLYFSPPRDAPTDTLAIAIEKLPAPDAAVNVLLENMPLADKYSLLLQSYATNIIDDSNRSVAALDTMDSLYAEMISKSIAPSEKSSKLLIDASSTFCSSIKLGKSLQLAKAGGSCNAFGAANGLLSVPITVAALSMMSESSAVPYDNREKEVLYAGLVAGISTLWLSLQVSQTFNSELHPWTTLLGVCAVGLCALDVATRQGTGIKLASAGLERLVLKDAERETHSDGAAFLVGYLLGLPCFCFRPDVTEALKMLRDDPKGLSFYRQPKAQGLSKNGKAGGKKPSTVTVKEEINAFQSFFGTKGSKPKKDKNVGKIIENADRGGVGGGGEDVEDRLQLFTLPSIPTLKKSTSENESEELIGLGRVLVWLMAPVAAEYLKYGKTIVSDPRRSLRLLSIIEKVQMSDKGSKSNTFNIGNIEEVQEEGVTYRIPVIEEDKKVLLHWAFYEATSLIRQYGDLLEDVNGYLATGTATVGECVNLVEEELR